VRAQLRRPIWIERVGTLEIHDLDIGPRVGPEATVQRGLACLLSVRCGERMVRSQFDGVVMADVTLAEAVASLRSELQQAMEEGEGETLRFALGPVQLELELTASESAGADGKIGLWRVITIGGKAERSLSSTHRLTLTLTPRVDGGPSTEAVIGRDLPERPS
jgi:hypothetical protein